MILPLAQFCQHIFQREWPQLIQFNLPDVGVHNFQHPPVAGNGSRRVLYLPVQPAQGIFFKSHLSILGKPQLDGALHFLSSVDNILPDTTFADAVRNINRLCF